MSLVLGGFDMGEDDDEMEGEGFGVVGRARARMTRGGRVKVPTPKWMSAATSQGVSRPQEEMDFLPFESVELLPATLTGVLIAKPQRPFRGERLIISAVTSLGVDAASNVVIDPAIYVGAVQVGGAQGSTPIQAFGANAFGVRLSFPAAGQGTEIKIYVRALTAPAVSNTVVATIIGRAMR